MYETGRFTAASAASLVPCAAFSSVGSVGAATVKISCVLLSFSSDDTLIEISKKFYGSSQMVMQLKEVNGLDDINKIYIGQELTLP